MSSNLGQGIGGFVGGQLVSNAGVSLPLLFQVMAGFSFAWTAIFYFIYKIFCHKYENQLIKAKEAEENNADDNKETNGKNISFNKTYDMEMRQRQNVSERTSKTKSTFEFEDSMKYWNTQISGKTSL